MTGRYSHRMEARLIRKREAEADRQRLWSTQCKYYDQFTRRNQQYQTWTSPEMNATSLKRYEELEASKKRQQQLEEERNKRDLELYEQKQRDEIAAKIEAQQKRNRFNKDNNTSHELDVLRELNQNLNQKRETERRLDAEKKLYEHWRLNNPQLRQAEMNQRQSNLKVAWLDAQIEKQMAKERDDEEMKRMLIEREQRLKEQDELDKQYDEQLKSKQAAIHDIINKQMEALKQHELLSEQLRKEEAFEIKQKDMFDAIACEHDQIKQRTARLESDLFNLNQYRLKLRRRAKIVAEQVADEKQLLEKILELELAQHESDKATKNQIREQLESAIVALKKQQQLEAQRDEYLSFIFDSEARAMWQKQEQLWRQEQIARDHLFNDVFNTIQCQIDAKIQLKVDEQKRVLAEKEKMLAELEAADQEMKQQKLDAEKRKQERSNELDVLVNDKKLRDKQAVLLEQIAREQQIENYKKEEERLRNEIAQLQLNTVAKPVFYPRRRIIW